MPKSFTSDDFLECVRKSGVVEAKRLDAYLKQKRSASALPDTPSKWAGTLVRDGLLTHFQAEQLLRGKWRGFSIGKYKLLERIGSGGMGSVYLCAHASLNRRVAIKILPPDKAKDPAALERFYREGRAVAALDHPNIVRAHDIDQAGQVHFLVMEYVEGSSLQEIVKLHGPMDPVRAAHYIAQAALGLQHAHEAGLVHRDIKPGNLLLQRNGTLKILDMGLSRFFADDSDNITQQYEANCVLGTADFLSPEQAVNSHAADIRSDIYSLGFTFYFLLAGRSPFSEGTVSEKLIWHQMRQPPSIREARPEAPEEMAVVLEKMIAKDQAERYQIPIEVVEALIPWTQVPILPPPTEEMPSLSLAASAGQKDTKLSSTTLRPRLVANPTAILRKPSPGTAIIPQPMRTDDPTSRVKRAAPSARAWFRDWRLLAAVSAIALAVVSIVGWWALSGPSRDESAANRKTEFIPAGQTGQPPETAKVVPAVLPKAVGEIRRFEGHTGSVSAVAISPDGRQVLSGSADQTMRLWDFETGQPLKVFTHPKWIRSVAFSPDGRRALSGSGDRIRLWDLSRDQSLRQLDGHSGDVYRVVFSPDGHRALSAGNDKTVRLWDLENGQELQRFTAHTEAVYTVAFSPDGRCGLSSGDKTVRLWDLETGRPLRIFRGHTGVVRTACFSPDGRRILSGGWDNLFFLWDVEKDQPLRTFPGHREPIRCMAFLPDGRRAVSGSGGVQSKGGDMSPGTDSTIRLWDVETGKEIGRFEGHAHLINGIDVSPDGRHAVSGSWDKTVRLWDLQQASTAAAAPVRAK